MLLLCSSSRRSQYQYQQKKNGLAAAATAAADPHMSTDYYEILRVARNASDEQIKRAYRKLAVQFHPDKNPDQKERAEAKFKEIGEAYSVLSDPEKRQAYDRFGKQGVQASAGPQQHQQQPMMDPNDVFRAFFGGQDPFVNSFQFDGPGMAFQFMGPQGRRFFAHAQRRHHPSSPNHNHNDHNDHNDNHNPHRLGLKIGMGNFLTMCFILWIMGVPFYFLWLMLMICNSFGLL